MIPTSKIAVVRIGLPELYLVKYMAHRACLNGSSSVRFDEGDREENLYDDNLVGQANTLALHYYLFKQKLMAEDVYNYSRLLANMNPTQSDGGQDVLDSDIDMKGSMIREWYKKKDPNDMRCSVREYHDNWIYVFGFVSNYAAEQHYNKEKEIIVKILGWLKSEDLPPPSTEPGKWNGARYLWGRDIRPLPIPKNLYPSIFSQQLLKHLK